MNDPIYKYFPEWKDTKKYIKEPNRTVKVVPTDGPIKSTISPTT